MVILKRPPRWQFWHHEERRLPLPHMSNDEWTADYKRRCLSLIAILDAGQAELHRQHPDLCDADCRHAP